MFKTQSTVLMLKQYLFRANCPVIPDVLQHNNNTLTRQTTAAMFVCACKMRQPEQNLLHRACKQVKSVTLLWFVAELSVIQAFANGTLMH